MKRWREKNENERKAVLPYTKSYGASIPNTSTIYTLAPRSSNSHGTNDYEDKTCITQSLDDCVTRIKMTV